MIPYDTKRVLPGEAPLLRKLNSVFAEAFNDVDSYDDHPPSDAYLDRVLAKDDVIALVALADDKVVGGLVAYELAKLRANGARSTSTTSPWPSPIVARASPRS